MEDSDGSRPVDRARPQRIISFAVGLFLSACAGTLYAFGSFNKEMKAAMGYDTSGINLVQSLGGVGQYFGLIGGKIFDRFGIRAALTYGIVMAGGGYTAMYLLLKYQFATNPVVMGLFYLCVGQGSAAMYMPALTTNVKNMPAVNRGLIVGIMAAGFGISSGLWTGVYTGAFQPSSNVEGLLLTLAIALTFANLTGMLLLKVTGPPPLPPPLESGPQIQEGEVEVRLPVLPQDSPTSSTHDDKTPLMTNNKPEIDITNCALLSSFEFWLLFVLFGLGCGAGLMLIGNASLVAESNYYTSKSGSALVIILSVANCLGRIIVGGCADKFSGKFSNSFWLALTAAITGLAHILLVFLQEELLFVCAILNGLAYGGLFAIVPKLLSERFGTKSFGFNFAMITLALAGGNMALNAITGKLYDDQVPSGQTKCYGPHCYRYAFIITSSCCLAAFLLSIVMSRITKKKHQWL